MGVLTLYLVHLFFLRVYMYSDSVFKINYFFPCHVIGLYSLIIMGCWKIQHIKFLQGGKSLDKYKHMNNDDCTLLFPHNNHHCNILNVFLIQAMCKTKIRPSYKLKNRTNFISCKVQFRPDTRQDIDSLQYTAKTFRKFVWVAHGTHYYISLQWFLPYCTAHTYL